MKWYEICLLLIILCFFIYLFKSCTYVENNYYIQPTETTFKNLDSEMFELINKHRKEKNLNTLKGAENLTNLSKEHVIWMLNNEISHYGYGDRENKAHAYSFGEVICPYRTSAYSYLMSYLHSVEGHKEVLEKNNITHIGIYTDKNTGLQCILVAGY